MKIRNLGIYLLIICLVGGGITAIWALVYSKASAGLEASQKDLAMQTNVATHSFSIITRTPYKTMAPDEGMILIVHNEAGKVSLAREDHLETFQISSDDVRAPLPSLSADGTRIAFRDLDGYLNVVELSSQKRTTYSDALMSGFWSIGWSPDGERIVYNCPTMPAMCIYTLKTGELTVYDKMENDSPGSLGGYAFAGWSSDAEKMGLLYYSEPAAAMGGTRTYFLGTIKLLDLNTEIVTDVFAESSLSGIEHMQDANLSPDGSSFLFSAKSGEYYAVYQVQADGSGLTRITPETLQFSITSPLWRPDGKGFVTYAPAQGNESENAVYLPTVFDLSGKIINQIGIDGGGKASSWIGNWNYPNQE